MVEDRVSLHRSDDAGWQADDQRDQDGAEGKLDGGREELAELGEHVLPRHDRLAEIALQDALDIDAVLGQERLVEAIFLDELGVAGRVDAALARHGLDRVSRHEPDEEEGEQGDPDEGRDHETDPGQDEAEHGFASLVSRGMA